MGIKEQIIALLNDFLDFDKYYIVDVNAAPSKVRQKIAVLIDTDAGITLDECAEISHTLGHLIEENELIATNYTLEVSSPGVDFPLTMPRQYKKNIGRNLKVILKGGAEKKGEIVEVGDEQILLKESSTKKKIEPITHQIPFSEILKAQVQISFK